MPPMNCDGVDQYVEIGDVAPLKITGNKITISCWVNISSKVAEMKVFAKWADTPSAAHSYLLAIQGVGNDKVRLAISAGGVTSVDGTTALVVGTWYHVAGTYDGSDLRVYVNGVEENSAAKTGNIDSTTAPVRLGAGSGTTIASEEPFHGFIDDPRIYDRVLSAEEIATIHASQGHDEIVVGLQARYLTNEEAAQVKAFGVGSVKDVGPHNLDGTPNNDPEYAPGVLNFRKRAA